MGKQFVAQRPLFHTRLSRMIASGETVELDHLNEAQIALLEQRGIVTAKPAARPATTAKKTAEKPVEVKDGKDSIDS